MKTARSPVANNGYQLTLPMSPEGKAIALGTTLIAAEKFGRRGYGVEINPAYCDVTIRRLHAVYGLAAVLRAGEGRSGPGRD